MVVARVAPGRAPEAKVELVAVVQPRVTPVEIGPVQLGIHLEVGVATLPVRASVVT
ncbi:conserved protein of unknown function [Ectopseudomonas oleovorans]|uniref:Uncharacterized protein n=1 Tax=Ectopseudomonas oleovorans TaxID=301 RepID=A0A653B9I1_ECTOL|nr:conserved protein of unknown function [Pseudomonas oleovorans]